LNACQGRLLSCDHDTRGVTRTEYDGSITVIAARYDGKPLNSPKDAVCKSDGSIDAGADDLVRL
jgi:gluconolactonase